MGKITVSALLFPGLSFPGFILAAGPVYGEGTEPHITAYGKR